MVKRRERRKGGERKEVVVVLPMDMIEGEILCRLPVKHLLRCKSVCKRWYSLIRNPNPKFINTHYQYQIPPSPLFLEQYRKKAITFNPSTREGCSIWPNPMVVNQSPDNLLLFPYCLGLPRYSIFLRPVKGMSLIVHPNTLMTHCRMAMFNPATRRFYTLPVGDFAFNALNTPKGVESYRNHIFGFGTCRTRTRTRTNNITSVVDGINNWVYKVIWLNLPPSNQPRLLNQRPIPMDVAVAKVYTVYGGEGMEDEDWRMVNAALPRNFVDDYCSFPSLNVSVNGKCYWLSKNATRLLVFDMDEEVFQEIDTPVTPIKNTEYGKLLWQVVLSDVPGHGHGDEGRDSLAVFVFESLFVDISILNTKELRWCQRRVDYVFYRPLQDLFDQPPAMLQQLQSPITDFIVLKAGQESFALYNPKTNICLHFRDPYYDVGSSSRDEPYSYCWVFAFNFKESLFSLDGGIEVSDSVLERFSLS